MKNDKLYIMIGLMVIGLCFVMGVRQFKSYDRVVSVKGLCEKEVQADNVIWPIAYRILGNNLLDIYDEINSDNEIVTGFLADKGINSSDISISAPEIIDMEANQYSENRSPYRYIVTSVITVSTGQIEKVKSCLKSHSELLKRGIALYTDDYKYNITFSYNALNDIKPEMIEEATKNARTAAEKFAKDSKSRIGKIKRANQGVFSVSDRDMNTPEIKKIRVVTSIDYYLR